MANPLKGLVKKFLVPKKPIEDVNGLFLDSGHFMRVVEQPSGHPEYVSGISNVATRFSLPTRYGNVGLIAHNFLSGKYFLELQPGDFLYLMDGYGKRRRYLVKSIQRYQALQPRSPRSNFINLDTQEFCSASEVFKRVYMGNHRVVLQTCIQKGSIEEWGRHFVIAEPANENTNQRISPGNQQISE
jgi:hypothetical protein